MRFGQYALLSVLFLMGCTQDYSIGLFSPEPSSIDAGPSDVDPLNPSGLQPSPEPLVLVDHEQTFQIEPQTRRVDMLFVIDNSGSMDVEQATLASAFTNFISNFQNRALDFQIGVVSTDVTPIPGAALGTAPWSLAAFADFSNQGPGSLLSYRGNERILGWQSPNLAQQFSENVRLPITGSSWEMGVQSTIHALSDELTQDWNQGFVRDEALLSVIFVSDEDETLGQGAQTYLSTNPTAKAARLAAFDAAVMKVKQNRRGLVRVDSIVRPRNESCSAGAAVGQVYIELAALYGGKVSNICRDFSGDLASLGDEISIQVQSRFALDVAPYSAVQVSVGGRILQANLEYVFEAASNSVQLVGEGRRLVEGSPTEVVLRYQTVAN